MYQMLVAVQVIANVFFYYEPAFTLFLTAFLCLSVSQSLIEAHDKVAAKCYEMPHTAVNSNALLTSSLMPADAVRMIGIQKKAGEPLVRLVRHLDLP